MVVALCVGSLLLTGCGSSDDARADGRALRVDRFDSKAAWRLVKEQVDVGQRPAGSPQLRRLAERLRRMLPAGRFEPVPGEPGLRNIVGTLPGPKPAIVIGAHYDTLVKPKGFVGANNGAAGTAVVVGVARALARADAAAGSREVRFVLFDGEEPAAGLPEESRDFYHSGLRGSRAYVKAHPGETAHMVLLDYVGNKGLRLPREGSSSIALWSRLRSAARRVGARRQLPGLLERGHRRRSLALPQGRRPGRRPDRLALPRPLAQRRPGQALPASLDAVGETVAELAGRLRAER